MERLRQYRQQYWQEQHRTSEILRERLARLDQDAHNALMHFYSLVLKEANNRFDTKFTSLRERLVKEAEERFYQEGKLLREKLVAEGEQSASNELKYFKEIIDKDLEEFAYQQLPLIKKTYEMQAVAVAPNFLEDWKYVLERLEYLIRERGNQELKLLQSSLAFQLEELASARPRIAELEAKLAAKETMKPQTKFKRPSLKQMQFSGLKRVLPVFLVLWLASVLVRIL